MRQPASLSMSNHTIPLMSGKLVRRVGRMSSIHFPLSPPASADASQDFLGQTALMSGCRPIGLMNFGCEASLFGN